MYHAMRVGARAPLHTIECVADRLAARRAGLRSAAIAFCLATALLPRVADAAGIRSVSLGPCLPRPREIAVDGRLNEWRGVEAVAFAPLEAFGQGDLASGRRDLGASVRTCYDADALYIAVEWLSPVSPSNTVGPRGPAGWQTHGDGMALHFLDGRTVAHVVSYPSADGRGATIVARRGDAGAWADLSTSGGAAAVARRYDAAGYAQELKIPWSVLTRKGVAPLGGAPEVMLDLVWRALPAEELPKLGQGIRDQCMHVTYNVLTARARLFSSGYLSSPGDWGEIVFADASRRARSKASPLGRSATTMTAARARTPPVVDGTLTEEEWPLESFVDGVRAPGFLGRRFACALAARFDTAALYLAARFSSPTPPTNTAVEVAQNGFKGGDCLQIRLRRDDKTVNLCGWLQSASGEPALTADNRDLAKPFLLAEGAKERFGVEPGGYTMELSVPWSALFPGRGAPESGDKLKATFQAWWLGADPRFSLRSKLDVVARGPLAVTYRMPRDAEVSLGVFDRDGRLLRWLTRSEHRSEGTNTEYWDGRDQFGDPLVAGRYRLKGIYHDPLGTEYALTLGNPGTPPWPTGDNKGDWLSDEADPQAAATDGAWVFLAAPGCEKGWAIIAVDESGQRQWGVQQDFYPRSVALAVHGDYVYALFSGPELTDTSGRFNGKNAEGRAVLICLDKRTGAVARFSKKDPRLRIATFPYHENMIDLWTHRTNSSFDPNVYGGKPRYADIDFGEASNALSLAVTSERVYVSMNFDDTLLAFDAETGEAVPEGDIPLAKPVGLCALSDRELLAVSDGSVVRVDTRSKRVTPFITSGLAAPHSIAVDRRGSVYVSDWRDSFQVKVFSSRGRYRRAIGRKGGRPWVGAWEKDGMILPRGIAVTDRGELWVTEDDGLPPRISVWNARTGRLLRDYIGPTPYGGGSIFWVDPRDTSIMHTLGTRFRVDWMRKTYRPLATEMRRMSMYQPFTPHGRDLFGVGNRVLYHEGREYVFVSSAQTVVSVHMRKGDVYVPVAAIGGLHRWSTDDGTGRDQWDSDLGKHRIKNYYPDFFRGHAGDNYSWYDKNANGLVEAEEMTWVKTIFRFDPYEKGRQPEFQSGWGRGIGPDWSLYFAGFCKDCNIIDRVDLQGWTDQGIPIYDLAEATEIATLDYGVDGLYVTDTNELFATGALSWHLGRGTVPDRSTALSCFDRDGTHRWSIAGVKEQRARDVIASNVIGELSVPGIGTVACTWHWWGNWRPYLISADGLYVGTVLDDGKLGPAGLWDESLNYFYQAPDGTPYVINGGNNGHHFLEITGLDDAGRFESRLVITEEDAKLAATSVRDTADDADAQKPVVAVRWLDEAPAIDGELDDWDVGYGAQLDGGEGRTATACLGRDRDTLYLGWRVEDDSPLLNKGGNWQTLFITGDCVDLMLATDPKADAARRAPAAGDVRLLLTVFQDEPVAVVYKPVAPGAGTQPVRLMAARIDRIDRLSDARVSIKRGDGFYQIEAAVALGALGLSNEAIPSLRGDVGVIYSDATGRDRIKRVYYYNSQTSMTADLTTEATLQPAEWGTMLFPLGRNLLRDGGFENDFVDRAEDGWALTNSVNGMTAELSSETSHSGRQALVIRQVELVTYAEEAFEYQDYGRFVKSANGGKGGGGVSVQQRIPVTGGKTYSMRFYFRSEGMKPEEKRPGKNRGYSTVSPWVYWVGGDGGQVWVGNEQRDTDGWAERTDARVNYWGVPKHYTAPRGATAAVIAIHAGVNAPNILPTIVVDDVEFVKIEE